MSTSMLIFLSFLLALGALAERLWRHAARQHSAKRAAVASKPRPAPAAPPVRSPAPRGEPLDWPARDLDFASKATIDKPVSSAPATSAQDLSAKLRNRYIAARFPGLFHGSADLDDVDFVIRAARLYFDERKLERAAELLDLAARQSPAERALRLAQLEFAFLAQDRALYLKSAEAFQADFAGAAEWAEIVRLGHALDSAQPLFAAAGTRRAHEHYGPWPDTPNWIQASWDLTSEVLAAEFHVATAMPQPIAPREAA